MMKLPMDMEQGDKGEGLLVGLSHRPKLRYFPSRLHGERDDVWFGTQRKRKRK
jgi:hypothetical protein